jgi:LacI family transcriptional regulator, galactose operon repressor
MIQRPHVLLMIETSLAYGRSVLHGITRYVLANRPWSISLDLRELESAPPGWLKTWRGDGIICRFMSAGLASMLKRRRIPTVDLTDIQTGLGFPQVLTDQNSVARLASAHLLERGFKQFGFCGFSGHDWSRRRRDGFVQSLADAGFSCAVYETPWNTARQGSWEKQQDGIGEWVHNLPHPVGVMACNDMRGQHVLDACRRRDIAVPEQVAVVGVDDDKLLCELCDPPLSSIIVNAERVGYVAAAMLDRLMQKRALDQTEVLVEPLGIAARQSTEISSIDDPLVASAVRFIREHACEGIGVEDVLEQVPLSRSMLERRFRKFLKRSPQEQIRMIQIERVKQLLIETDFSQERIAALAGYEHFEYMSVVFKRETGRTPGQFRREAKT